MNADFIHVIIPTLGYSKMLQDCVDSIEKFTNYKNYEILIVNTKSVVNDSEISKNIIEKYENVFCKNTGYYHFAKTNNEAVNNFLIDMTQHGWENDFVVFCNNDIVFKSDCIGNMMEVFRTNENVGIVGSLLFFPDNTIQHAGVGLDEKTINCFHLGYKRNLPDDLMQNLSMKKFGKVVANTAALMMMKTFVFKNFDGFDEEYKICFEDLDLNLRLGIKGFDNFIAYNSTAVHNESSSRGKQLNRLDVFKIRAKMAEYMYEMEKRKTVS